MKKINVLLFFIMICSFIGLSINVLELGILPFKYLTMYFCLIGILSIIFFLFTFFNKSKIIKWIIFIFMILITILSFFVSNVVLEKANDFFDNIKEVNEMSTFYVISLKDKKIKDISDLKDKVIGVSSNGIFDGALEVINDKVKCKIEKYDNLFELYNDLLDGKISAIYVDSNIKRLFDEINNDFSDKVNVIGEFNIKKSIDEKKKKEEEEARKAETINIYISGIDTYGAIDTVSRSDVNIIMSINRKNKKILLTTIPRDSYVLLHGTSGPKDKLTHAGIYGINMSVNTLEDFLGIDIHYYVRVNFDTLVSVIDSIGGVDVYSDLSFSGWGESFNQGYNHMNGKKALVFCRLRKMLPGGDRSRGQHQQAVITAIVKKVTSSKVLLRSYGDILSSLSNSFQSNIDNELIKELVKEQLDSMSSWDIRSISVDGSGMHTTSTYSMPGWNLYVMVPNYDTVNNARNEINNLKN